MAFESVIDPHDNEQLASALMSALPASIGSRLCMVHGTTGTSTKLVTGFTILQCLHKLHVGMYAV